MESDASTEDSVILTDESSEEEDVVLPCGTCGAVFSSQTLLDMHERVHREKKGFRCEVCGRVYTRRYNMLRHALRAHGSEIFKTFTNTGAVLCMYDNACSPGDKDGVMRTSGEQILYAVVLQSFISGGICTYRVWEGGNVVLQCGVGSSETSFKEWCKMIGTEYCAPVLHTGPQTTDVFPPWSSADVQVVEGSSLRFTSVSYPRDNGTFRCTSGHIDKSVELVILVGAKSLILSGPEFPVPENTEVTFTCEAEGGDPAPNITWEIPETSSQPEPTVSDGSSQISLTLTKDMNNKQLGCKAWQGERTLTETIKLNITYKPTVKILVSPAEYTLGDEVTLTCQANGFPRPDTTWTFEGNTTTDDVNRTESKMTITDNNHTGDTSLPLKHKLASSRDFRIGRLSQQSIGTYTCVAVNSEGSATGVINLTLGRVKDKESFFRELLWWTGLGVLLLVMIIVLIVISLYVRSKAMSQGNNGRLNLRRSSGAGLREEESHELRILPENRDGTGSDDEETLPKRISSIPDVATSGRAIAETDMTDDNVAEPDMPDDNIPQIDNPDDAMPETDMPQTTPPGNTAPDNARPTHTTSEGACAATEEHVYDEPDHILPQGTRTGSKDGRIALISGNAREGMTIPDTRMPKTAPPGKAVPKPAKPKKPKPKKTDRENTTSVSARVKMSGARAKESGTAIPEEDLQAKILPGEAIARKQTSVKGIRVKDSSKKAISAKVMQKSAVSENDMPEKFISELPVQKKIAPINDSPEMAASEQTLVKTTLLKDTTLDNTVPKTVMSKNEEAEWIPRASVKEHEYEELDDIADEVPPPPCKKKPVVTVVAEPRGTSGSVSREEKAAPSRSRVTACDDPLQPSPALQGTSTYIVAPETDKRSPGGMTRSSRFPVPPVSGTALSPLATSRGTSGHTCSSATEDPGHLGLRNPPRSLQPSVDVTIQSSPPASVRTVEQTFPSAAEIAAEVLKMLDERAQCTGGGQLSDPPSGRRLPATSTTTDEDQCKGHDQSYANI